MSHCEILTLDPRDIGLDTKRRQVMLKWDADYVDPISSIRATLSIGECECLIRDLQECVDQAREYQ